MLLAILLTLSSFAQTSADCPPGYGLNCTGHFGACVCLPLYPQPEIPPPPPPRPHR